MSIIELYLAIYYFAFNYVALNPLILPQVIKISYDIILTKFADFY